jgi:hypothetical protein
MRQGRLTSLVNVLVVVAIAISSGGLANQPSTPPYAFLLGGDVWIAYEGQKLQMTKLDDVEDFAVSSDGTVLVLERQLTDRQEIARVPLPAQNRSWYAFSPEVLQIVSLKGEHHTLLRALDGNTALEASCGTVLAMTGDPTEKRPFPSVVRDVKTWEPVVFDAYRDFACSSDRGAVVGVTGGPDRVLMAGNPPNRELLKAGRYQCLLYDISPNGRYVAYSPDGTTFAYGPGAKRNGKLCVAQGAGRPTCVDTEVDRFRLSVSDSGEVLFVRFTEQACHVRDQWHASLEPRPGYTEGDICMALFYWRPGGGDPIEVDFLGLYPQWLSPGAASALLEWSKRSQGRPKADWKTGKPGKPGTETFP